MKKIAFVYSCFNNNNTIVNVNEKICEMLSITGDFDVTFICNRFNDKNRDVKYKRVSLHTKSGSVGKYISFAHELKKVIRKHKYDYVVVSGLEYAVFSKLAIHKKSKIVLWNHRNIIDIPRMKLERIGLLLAYIAFEKIIVITKKDLQACMRRFKNKAKFKQIYNPIKSNANDKSLCLSNKMISAGSITSSKGFDMVIPIAKLLNIKETNYQWDIYGEGDYASVLEKQINDSEFERNIKIKGYDKNLDELYQQYSLFINLSKSEGFGMVVPEAQVHGLPVVSFDINCGPSDMITNDINGYLIKPFEIEQMADMISIIMGSKEKRMLFSKYSTINHKELSNDNIVYKWASVFEE